MNRLSISKFLVGAALAGSALGAASVAHARPDVSVSIGVQSGPAWVAHAPVYVRPQPVYVQPAPVYRRPPVIAGPRVVFEQPRWIGYDARPQWERERAWRHAEQLRHERLRHERVDGWRGGDRGHDDHGHGRGRRD